MTWRDIEAGIPDSFECDGCTNWPDKWRLLSWLIAGRFDWSRACRVHDWLYRDFRLTPAPLSRAQADRLLREGVADLDAPVMAWIMWAGVRVFGWIAWNGNAKRMGL